MRSCRRSRGPADAPRGRDPQRAGKYAQNPDDPAVFSELTKWNPEMAIQIRQQQSQQHQQALEAHRDNILKGAQIIRQLGVKDQAGWDQARAMAGQMGIDLSEVPAQFDPNYIHGMVSIADAFAQQHGQQGTAMQQNYEFLKGQDPNLADSYLHNQAEGPPLVSPNGDGTFTIIPRAMIGGNQAPPAPPPPGFVIDGGPTPQASGGFPGGPL
jgi:hypothetical protein